MHLNIGGFVYEKHFITGAEQRHDVPDSETNDHSYDLSYTLPNGVVFECTVTGVLKGIVRIDETQKVKSAMLHEIFTLLSLVQLLILGPPSSTPILSNVFAEQEEALELVPDIDHATKQRVSLHLHALNLP
jgi:hypothetical protein